MKKSDGDERCYWTGRCLKTLQAVGLRLSEDQEKGLIYNALEEKLWIQKDAAIRLVFPRGP